VGPPGPGGADPAPAQPVSGVDGELLALPAPPRARRLLTLTLMALVAAGALGVLGGLRADIRYFFSAPRAVDVGTATGVDPAALVPNTFVRIEGMPMAALTVRYARAMSGREYAVFPLAGQRHVLVQVPVDDLDRLRASSRRQFSGRLVTVGQLGPRFSAVRSFLAREMAVPVTSETFVLLADEAPGRYGWALVLAGLCVLFIGVNVALMVRWFRPLRD
jgi:hypothetical protein